jgi:hypothetical protein
LFITFDQGYMEHPPCRKALLACRFRTDIVILALLFLAVTAMNLTKAYHMDDSYHLQAAQWIAKHPFHPMSGTVNWSGSVEHFYNGNQPPLFFYGVAAWGALFGYGEVAMHLFESLFAALAIYFFYGLARSLAPSRALLLTSLLALGPAFIVNQNVMLDVPLLSMMLGFLFFVEHAIRKPGGMDLLSASLFLTLGILIKYTLLALFPILLLAIVLCGNRRWWVALVLPAILVLWSLWNLDEFGRIHLLGRSLVAPGDQQYHMRTLSWIMTLGSVAPWLFASWVLQWNIKGSAKRIIIGSILGMVCLFLALAWTGVIGQPVSDLVLVALFVLNGLAGLISLAYITKKAIDDRRHENAKFQFVLIGSLLCLAAFTILFVPWMATRHLLLVLPMFLLLSASFIQRMTKDAAIGMVLATGLLGISLGISDRRFAAFYRDAAETISAQYRSGHVWYLGSLGWGWYAQMEGMRNLASTTEKPASGDVIAIPMDFSAGTLPAGMDTVASYIIHQQLGYGDRFSTRHWLRFYSAGFPQPPWDISLVQAERILLVRTR